MRTKRPGGPKANSSESFMIPLPLRDLPQPLPGRDVRVAGNGNARLNTAEFEGCCVPATASVAFS
jgi:hypothetical protein